MITIVNITQGRIHNLHGSTDLRATKREGYSENDKQQLQFQEMYVPQILSQDSHSKGSEVQVRSPWSEQAGPKESSNISRFLKRPHKINMDPR